MNIRLAFLFLFLFLLNQFAEAQGINEIRKNVYSAKRKINTELKEAMTGYGK